MAQVIVITGGPCAGKTTIMANQAENLINRGFWPLICPESATLLYGTGLRPDNKEFQCAIFATQRHMETMLATAAKHVQNPVILCDRGLLDSLAYVDRHVLDDLARPATLEYMRDSRYKAVIHLETAAKDAEEYYTLINNQARTETLHQARLLDDRLIKAWNGHPKHIVIANKGLSFDQKKDAALDAVLSVLGYPVPIEDEERYLIDPFFKPSDITEHCVATTIVQDYLVSSIEMTERVRARGNRNSAVYFHTIKRPIAGTTACIEEEEIITKKEYMAFLRRRDPDCRTIRKTRYTFHSNGLYFELDLFTSPVGIQILEVEKTRKNTSVSIPACIEPFVLKNITGMSEYSNASLARHFSEVENM